MATRQPDRAISMTTLFCTPHPEKNTSAYRIEFYLKTRRNHHHHHHHHHHGMWNIEHSISQTRQRHILSLSSSVLSYLSKTSVPRPSQSGHGQGIECFCPLPRSQELNLWFSAHKAHKLGSQGPGGVQQCPHRLVTYTHKYCTLTSSFVQHNEDYC